jgi:hypothetical protein
MQYLIVNSLVQASENVDVIAVFCDAKSSYGNFSTLLTIYLKVSKKIGILRFSWDYAVFIYSRGSQRDVVYLG